jgi:hypothetical protein
MTVPDAVDPIVGWRYWKVTSAGLASLNVHGGYWPPRAPHEAKCRAAPISIHHSPDVIPSEACGCGIYAARDLETLKQLVYPFSDPLFRRRRIAVGEVLLWGRVIEGTRGYRAQHAYPKSLYVVARKEDEEWIRFSQVALEGAYGVPVGVLSRGVAVGTNPDIKALFGLVGVASATLAFGLLAGKAAGQRARLSEALTSDIAASGGPSDAL